MMILIKILTFEISFPLSMELEYESFCKTSSIITEKYLEAPQTYFSDKENRGVMQKICSFVNSALKKKYFFLFTPPSQRVSEDSQG